MIHNAQDRFGGDAARSISSRKSPDYNRELAIGTILAVVLLLLLIGFCMVSTMPSNGRGLGPGQSGGMRGGAYAVQDTGGNAGSAVPGPIKNAL